MRNHDAGSLSVVEVGTRVSPFLSQSQSMRVCVWVQTWAVTGPLPVQLLESIQAQSVVLKSQTSSPPFVVLSKADNALGQPAQRLTFTIGLPVTIRSSPGAGKAFVLMGQSGF